MAREATARLYDVDQSSVVLNRLTHTGDYDEGTIVFRADEGKLIDLERLHESLWATRLSGGTRSGVLKLEVTAVGEVTRNGEQIVLKVAGTDEPFALAEDPEATNNDDNATPFQQLIASLDQGGKVYTVTGRLEGWKGRWPAVLREKPDRPRRILVTAFEPPSM